MHCAPNADGGVTGGVYSCRTRYQNLKEGRRLKRTASYYAGNATQENTALRRYNMYRPKNWINPYLQRAESGDWVDSKTFEAGADAMLEALKKEGTHTINHNVIPVTIPGVGKGYVVFIPDEEEQ